MRKFFLVFSITVIAIQADTFKLKNGKKLYGKIIEQTDSYIVYRDENDVAQVIRNTELESAEKDDNIREPGTETNPSTNNAQAQPTESSPNNSTSPTVKTADAKSTANLPKAEDDASIELTTEVVSDFVWRGNSYGGEYLARRNNTQHKGTEQYWAFQPNLRVNAPIKGLYLELWGNFALVGRADRDSDMRLQAFPGGPAIDPNAFAYKQGLVATDPAANNFNSVGFFYDPSNNINNNKCAADATLGCSNPDNAFVDPRKVGFRKEKNGMARTDGVFTTFAYNFQNKKFGDITWGIWYYYQMDKNAKYSWDEYFIIWGLPFLQRVIKPTVSLYTQASFDFGSIYAGGHYLAYSMSHTFFEEKFFRIQPMFNLGYKFVNNTVEQKSGFYDATTNLRFLFGDFFFSVNNAYRPNLHMYDNDQFYFPVSQGGPTQPNRSAYDGKTADPSKLYGPVNTAVYTAIDGLDTSGAMKSYLKGEYQNQNIVRHLFWISFGYNMRF